jgi:hypothetical protein
MTNPEQSGKDSESSALAEIKNLFRQCRQFQQAKDISSARKIERRVAKLVAQIAAQQPNSSDHAEALLNYHYVLLSVAATSNRQKVSLALRNAAYVQATCSLRIKLENQGDRPELSTIFNASNLAIELIQRENRPEEGLQWLLVADSLLKKFVGECEVPTLLRFKFFSVDYNIAKANYDLGHREIARSILVHALSLAPRLDEAGWADLRGVARTAMLLSEILLDEAKTKQSQAV